MDTINNNQFEVKPTSKSKRKIVTPCPNVYLNPALDLLANEDPMCNTAMEIVPKKRKRTRSCDIAAFENSALDVGISKTAINEFLVRELQNVRKNVRPFSCTENVTENFEPKNNISYDLKPNLNVTEPIYADLTEISSSETGLNFSVNDLPIVPKRNPIISKSVPENIPDISLIKHNNITEKSEDYPVTDIPVLPIRNPIPVNLTDISMIPQNTIPDTSIDFSVNDVALLSNQDSNINDAMVLDNGVDISKSEEFPLTDMPTLLESTDIGNMVALENGMEVSRIDDVTDDVDSGISVLEQKSLNTPAISGLENTLGLSNINTTNIQATNQIFINNTSNLSLSFIDRLALDSPNISTQSLVLDDDLNESNIMEIKTITIITKKKHIPIKKKNTNPFLDPNLKDELNTAIENPFLNANETKAELEYNDEVINRPVQVQINQANDIQPRRLFASDTNSTISTVNESVNTDQNEYENIDGYRSESPRYENVNEMEANYNKQSKILGYDVSQLSAVDIMNLNKNCQANNSNESNDSKRDFKHQIMKASNKLSKKVMKKLKKTFKTEKPDQNATLNPYEVPRKPPKKKTGSKDTGIENPCLNLDYSDDDIEIEELDDDEEHQYETIKTMRNTRLNMNVTPLREKTVDNIDVSHNKTNTPGKKVRFDSTLNQEKIITGNSFDYGIQSPGFDAKIDKYHDELENCINERKFLQQNMD